MTVWERSSWQADRVWRSPIPLAVAAVVSYLVLVQALRFQRIRRLQTRLGYIHKADFARMSVLDAATIQKDLITLEFPFVYLKALQFALFKTYGFPCVSALLIATRQLVDPALAPKRYVDTTVLISEFCMSAPGSDRYAEAIARMNFIHSIYQKNGKIKNSEMLYTLSLFALEPGRWINKHDWRHLTDMERCAIGTFWKQVGDDMNISYSEVHGNDIGWNDGLAWLESMEAWSVRYEEEGMEPHPDNHTTANATLNILLWAVPRCCLPIARRITYVLMEDRLRIAMMYENPSKPYHIVANTLLYLRKKFVRFFMLPRPSFMSQTNINEKPNEHGRYNLRYYDNLPLYIHASPWKRFNAQAWWMWMMGKPVPGDEDQALQSEGYKISEVGPSHMVKLGQNDTQARKQELLKKDFGGCPFRI